MYYISVNIFIILIKTLHLQKFSIMFNHAYCSDKYQYTMGKTFFDEGMGSEIAIFNMFYRKAPDNNNWAVVSGIDEVIEMVQHLGKMPSSFYEKFLPGEEYSEFREFLSTLKFTGDIYAMKEGEIAFPSQPIITIVAPLIEAQILETPILSIMNHQMAVATKASRVCRSTNRPISEFGSRRAHGPWAAVYGAKAAIIAGCTSTSNILTGDLFDETPTGTMAHSYVSAFGCSVEGEHQAFNKYIESHKNEPLILLIDTYDTLKCGIYNAIRAYKENGIDDSYSYGYGIRLDSGDLAYLSKKVRKVLDQYGLFKCKIFCTNSLDEYIISDLERQEVCIDAYGVGDAIATSKDSPCFGNVYKLVQIGDKPVLKRSEDKIKLINPGFQITYRISVKNDEGKETFKVDITCLRGDGLSKKIENYESFTISDEYDRYKSTNFSAGAYKYDILQKKTMSNGIRCIEIDSLEQKKKYHKLRLSMLSASERRLINPHYYKVDISNELYNLKSSIIEKIVDEIKNFNIGDL